MDKTARAIAQATNAILQDEVAKVWYPEPETPLDRAMRREQDKADAEQAREMVAGGWY